MSGEISKLTDELIAPAEARLPSPQFISAGAVYMLDLSGSVVAWNAEAQEMGGFAAEQVLGQNFSLFFTDADRERGIPAEALAVAGTTGRYEIQGWRLRKEGSFYWAQTVIDAIRAPNGDVIGFIKITRDISELRNVQHAAERMREQLARAQKMQAVGELTGAVAYDFRNLLLLLGSQIERLRGWVADAGGTKPLDMIDRVLRMGDSLTRQLVTFAHRSAEGSAGVLDVAEHVAGFREVLRSGLRSNITLLFEFGENLWPILAEAEQFELALLNAALRAREAMPAGGVFTISARNVRGGDGDEAVEIVLKDSGEPLVEEKSPWIFNPGVPQRESTAAGARLSQIRRFAQQTGGSMKTSSSSQGTVITLSLPRSREAAANREPAPTQAVGTNRVLLVEDNEDVAEVTQVMLTSLGYAVRWASDAIQAMDILNGRQDFDVVLSDIVMPGSMDGIALAQAVRERYSSLPCLLMTAFADSAQAAGSEFRVLRKPFKISMLREALEDTRA
jgi:PAS domain S-box-containing protein